MALGTSREEDFLRNDKEILEFLIPVLERAEEVELPKLQHTTPVGRVASPLTLRVVGLDFKLDI